MRMGSSRTNASNTLPLMGTIGIACLLAGPALGVALNVKAGGLKIFHVDPRAGGNQVHILSEATLEDFTSIVDNPGAQVQLDPGRLESLSGRLYFDLSDLKTGMDIRDRALKDPEWFDTARYPRAVLALNKVESLRKTGANTADMVLSGTCTIHGMTRPVRVAISLAYLDESPQTQRKFKGDVIRIRGRFDIKLSDYGVTGPKGSTQFVGVRVADLQKLGFTVFGSSEPFASRASANSARIQGSAP